MASGLRNRCHTWQPSRQAPAQAMEVEGGTPASEAQIVAGSSALTRARASGEASVSVGAPVAVGTAVSARTAASGTGTSGEGDGRRQAKRKRRKRREGVSRKGRSL